MVLPEGDLLGQNAWEYYPALEVTWGSRLYASAVGRRRLSNNRSPRVYSIGLSGWSEALVCTTLEDR